MSGGHSPERAALTRSAALASSVMAVTLLGLKAWAAWATASVSMLGSLADTALDLLASLLTLYAVYLASQPADSDHRFGHGKAEAIAALMQTLLILGSAVAILWQAIQAFGGHRKLAAPEIGIGVSLVGVVLTMVLVAWQRHVVRKTGSIAINTDSLHYQTDIALNLSVIAAVGLEVYAGMHGADAVMGVLIAGWIGYNAVRAARHALDMLMDREWPDEKRTRLIDLARTVPGVEGVHDLRTRSSGVTDFIQFHIWLPPEMPVLDAHAIVDAVEHRLHDAFPGAEIMIHVDPLGHYDKHSQTAAALDA